MAKRKTIVDDFQEIIDDGSLEEFKAVFERCEINATPRGSSTCNAFSYKNLTPEHIQFLIDSGLDCNADCGYLNPAVVFQSGNLQNLQCLVKNGADINRVLFEDNGTALQQACENADVQSVRNLISCGANVKVRSAEKRRNMIETTIFSGSCINVKEITEIILILSQNGVRKTFRSKRYLKAYGDKFIFHPDGDRTPEELERIKMLNELFGTFHKKYKPAILHTTYETTIRVKGNTWQEQLQDLGNQLVPAVGQADSVQGEMVRLNGVLSHEILDNGGMNWGKRFQTMIQELSSLFDRSEDTKSLNEEAQTILCGINQNSSREEMDRLAQLIVKWVKANPDRMPL